MTRASDKRIQAGTVFAALIALWLPAGSSAHAQPSGCTATPQTNPPREVLTCQGGLTIVVEPETAYRLLDHDGNGTPDGAELAGRGLLIEVAPSRSRPRFQIHTPHAIASVRGTVWAMDVTPERTSVFVARGAVAVRPQASRRTATLTAGDGVDVEASTVAPEVKRWSAQRAATLLARFGR